MNLYRTLAGLRTPPGASVDVDPAEEATAEVDEPPEHSSRSLLHSPRYTKAVPHATGRRESLLTRQLHSETEHSEEEHAANPRPSISGSIWSNNSVASTAELTSDDGKSVPSPAVSPPLAATLLKTMIPSHDKPLDKKIEIVGQEDASQKAVGSETVVEAGLGRRRCITFACGNKTEKPKASPPAPAAPIEPAAVASPPKRKCMIQFVCPSRPTQPKPSAAPQTKRSASPPPPAASRSQRKSGASPATKSHRGSDSTVTNASPKSSRKSPSASTTILPSKNIIAGVQIPSQDIDSDDSGPESTRFHEFATHDVEHEGWTQESTVHRSRLTISDTLQKENVIRRACEEVEEEAIEEDEEDEDEIDDLADVDDLEDDDIDHDDEHSNHGNVYRIEEESEDSDDGFHSDNEEGFADSDSDDGEDSDYEWWKPGGPSTAATSVEHLDRLSLAPRTEEEALVSSVGSLSSGQLSPRMSARRFQKATKKQKNPRALSIPRPQTPELPDSTDFVAGTLDEDRPLEQAYINNMKDRAAAKHRARPQDIDPTFPTSDPEIDDEDDDDLIDAPDSDNEQMMHGDLEELDGEGTVRARHSPRPSRRNANRSPAPPARLRSPPPPTRLHSPPPKRRTQHTSPPPPSRPGHAHSPRRLRSPAPSSRRTTPSNTRPGSPVQPQHTVSSDTFGLPQRNNVTHTASLPRGGPFRLNHMVPIHSEDERDSESTNVSLAEAPKRGAIDIYKGLERKRQRRKEKLYQKLCAKAAAKAEKAYKVKPGRGAERMREVGLELQRYKGKGEHILSV